MSEKLPDHGVLTPVVPPAAVPDSLGPDMTMPTSATNAAAAMRMPGRWYHGRGGSAGLTAESS
jgi:phytoene dehydrogenase-like protein